MNAKIGSGKRGAIIDWAAFPEKKLKDPRFAPKNWGVNMLRELMNQTGLKDIGFASVANNITSHEEILPNLACQIAQELGLNAVPEVMPYYGCAAGIFSINSAMAYCQKNKRAAAVFVFDQCTWICNPVYDRHDPLFKENLRANLLFGDGAVAALLVP